MKASWAKTTKPMRSNSRSLMNSATICFAASSLLGAKSVCPMLPEMSKAIAMSTPSPRTTCLLSLACGPSGGNNHQRQRQRTEAPK